MERRKEKRECRVKASKIEDMKREDLYRKENMERKEKGNRKKQERETGGKVKIG